MGQGNVRINGVPTHFDARVREITFDDYSSWHEGPDFPNGDVDATAPPGVTISDPLEYPMYGINRRECVTLQVNSKSAITRIASYWARIGPDGSTLQSELGNARKTFAPGKTFPNICITVRSDTTSGPISVGGISTTLHVKLLEIDFADGTVWKAPSAIKQ